MGCGCGNKRPSTTALPNLRPTLTRLGDIAVARFNQGPSAPGISLAPTGAREMRGQQEFSPAATDSSSATGEGSIQYEPADTGTRILAIITKKGK